MGVSVSIALLGAALAVLAARLSARVWEQLLGQVGFWVPLALLTLLIVGVLLLRSRFGRTVVTLEGERLRVGPGGLRRFVTGAPTHALELAAVGEVRALALREGTFLLLGGAPPVVLPLQHSVAPRVVEALLERLPESAWQGEAGTMARALVSGPPPREGGAEESALLAPFGAAGLWHLAAAHAWPALEARPEDPSTALALHSIERHRLPTHARLRLAMSLAARHPDVAIFTEEVARLALVLRLRDLAGEALDALVALPDPLPHAAEWRMRLRERRALPAPASRATFGIEIGMPTHRLEGDALVVNEHYRVGLDWFVAYRLQPGFWGPPRALEVVDLWGAGHLLRGDPYVWMSTLSAAAPHLTEVHDQGWIWPPIGPRLRVLGRIGKE